MALIPIDEQEKQKLNLLQDKIQYHFEDLQLLIQALTHKSFAFEKNCDNNERMEFLGDAVIQFVISTHLMEAYPDMSEGQLSKFRAVLVSETGLSDIAREVSLGDYLFLGKGERLTEGRDKKSILADALEAVFAAVYLDSKEKHGYTKVNELMIHIFKEAINLAETNFNKVDFKTDLQEIVQKQKIGEINYRIIEESGPEHNKRFVTELLINDEVFGVGKGKNKKSSEQNAAIIALETIKAKYDTTA
ncbi:MAG: ribonuclease III [Deltaproteobacteria bacterium]|nr:ribonuclease III [Deltaproteobacteria bacterium]